MLTLKHWTVTGLASVCLCGSAAAAEMTGAEIKALIAGNTAYVETGAASVTGTIGQGAIYYAPDGTGLYKTPMGAIWHGTWAVKGDRLCTEWKEGPKKPCQIFDRDGDAVKSIDSETGQVRIKILKIAPGNAEKLMPAN